MRSWFSNHHLYSSILRSVGVLPPPADRAVKRPMSRTERKELPSRGENRFAAESHRTSVYAPRQCVRMPGKPRSSPAAYRGRAPSSRARSHAEVATEPPAPSFPFSPTVTSSVSPSGKSELQRKKRSSSRRKTRGHVEGSATSTPLIAGVQSSDRDAQYWGSTTIVKSGSTPR